MNNVVLSGRLGQDVETRYTANGKQVANLSVAVDDSYKKENEWVKKTVWLRVAAWGKQAENASSLRKGGLVFVAGKLQENKWTDKDGNEKTKMEVLASEVHGLVEPVKGESKPAPKKEPEIDDSDIPF
jgi:single-strand DNA-binding protein